MDSTDTGRAAWIRSCHWLAATGIIVLFVSGIFILAVHPRLYWGEVGNALTPGMARDSDHRQSSTRRLGAHGDF